MPFVYTLKRPLDKVVSLCLVFKKLYKILSILLRVGEGTPENKRPEQSMPEAFIMKTVYSATVSVTTVVP